MKPKLVEKIEELFGHERVCDLRGCTVWIRLQKRLRIWGVLDREGVTMCL